MQEISELPITPDVIKHSRNIVQTLKKVYFQNLFLNLFLRGNKRFHCFHLTSKKLGFEGFLDHYSDIFYTDECRMKSFKGFKHVSTTLYSFERFFLSLF